MLESSDFFGCYEAELNELPLSINEYDLPVRNKDLFGIYKPRLSPAHKGKFAPAVDFAVSDPRVKKTEVLAPADGVVVAGRLDNTKWGETEEYTKFLNWVHIKTLNGEFFELAHINSIPGRTLRVGDTVKKGEVIAIAGLNGRVTTTNGEVDAHVHMFVGKYLGGENFAGLRIRWNEDWITK